MALCALLIAGCAGTPRLVGDFDFAGNEQCVQHRECARLKPFAPAGKAVFHVEYDLTPRQFCPTARALRLRSMRKHTDLGARRQPC